MEMEKTRREEDMERERMKMQEEKARREFEMLKYEEERERLSSPTYKAKIFGDALRGTMARMPMDAIEILPWLRGVEKMFSDFKIEESLRVHLLKPHMTEQARSILAQMDPEKASDYEEVKNNLLHEVKLVQLFCYNVLMR